eukprot:14506364-Alexandrium_andersonii.AAC.1
MRATASLVIGGDGHRVAHIVAHTVHRRVLALASPYYLISPPLTRDPAPCGAWLLSQGKRRHRQRGGRGAMSEPSVEYRYKS